MNTIKKDKPLIVLTGGKTMGHITPLITIYRLLQNDFSFIYLGLKNSMEEAVCQKNNIPFIPLDLLPFYRKKLHRNILTFSKIFEAQKKLKNELKSAKIHAILSSGGFVSIPAILAYKNAKCKKILFEANAVMGLANKYLSKYVDYVITQFPLNKKYLCLGYPVLIPEASFDSPFFYQNRPLVMFVGGSNGALDIVKYAYQFHLDYPLINCIVLTGEHYYDLYDFNFNARKYRKIDNLAGVFTKIDVVVSRSGGATIAELLMTRSKAVLVPSRILSNDHQYKNAIALKDNDQFLLASSYDEMKMAVQKLIDFKLPKAKQKYTNDEIIKLIKKM